MSFFDPQNPGLGGIHELTDAEALFVQNLASLAYAQGDVLYVDATGSLNRLPAGTSGDFLKTQGAGANPVWAPSTAAVTVGTTTISGGVTTKVLYDNAGVLGEYTVSGSGNVAMTTSPTFVTPTLGAATATSINKVTITAPTTSATLTIADGATLATSGAFSLTLTATAATNVTLPTTGTLATLAGSESLTNKTLDATNSITVKDANLSIVDDVDATKKIAFQLSGITTATTRTITIPDASGTMTLLGNASTGSGSVVLATSPTLVTPTLGVATATTINKVTLTAPATGSTLTIANGKTLTASNTLTLTGTDGSSVAFGGGGTVAYTSNNLSVFAATTSAQLAGVISDETGSGALVFGTSPTLTTPTIASIVNTGTLTLPTSTDTLVGRATTDTLTNKTLTAPKFAGGGFIADNNGNEQILFHTTASATTQVEITNAATGTTGPLINPGGETNIDIRISGAGTGAVHFISGTYGDITADTDGATVTFNLATSNLHTVTLGGNRTLALSNAHVGQVFTLVLVQDATGSRTVTWFSTIKWAGGTTPTLTTTASKADAFTFICYSSGNYYGTVAGQNF